MSESRIGLACAGGVVEGAFYEIGVVCALEEAIEGLDLTHLQIYVGVSAGAIVAACLASGIPPHVVRRAVLGQEAPDLNLRPEMLFTPALGEYVRRALELPGAAYRGLAQYLVRPADISLVGALMELGRGLPVGLFDSRPLERYLAHVFSSQGRSNSFGELPNKLRVLAVDLDTSLLTVFGEEETAHVPISRAVQASAAMPLLYPPVEIDGRYYIDGVARRTLNASEALEEGAELLFCINPIVPVNLDLDDDEGACVHPSLIDLGLPAVLSQTFRTMIHSRMRTGFKNYEYLYPDAEVVLIEPELSDHTMFFSNVFSFANRARILDHGYTATRAYLARNAGRLEPLLRRHGLTLRWSRLAGPPIPPPAEAFAPDGTTGEAVEGTRAVLERLERVLARLDAALPAAPAPAPAPDVTAPVPPGAPARAATRRRGANGGPP